MIENTINNDSQMGNAHGINKGTKTLRNKIFRKLSKVIVWIAFIILICCTYNIFTYFFGGNSEHRSKNEQRKWANYIVSSGRYNKFDDSRFLSTYNWKLDNNITLNNEIGPIPVEHPISTYLGHATKSYVAGYKTIKEYYKDFNAPIYSIYGELIDFKTKSYYENVPYCKDYNCIYSITSFDISDRMSFWENEDSTYSKYLKSIDEQYRQNFNGKTHYTYVADCKALSYYAFDSLDVKRTIFCHDKIAYLIEVAL